MAKPFQDQILDELEKLYPDAKAELHFSNPFETLIATILSAAMLLRYSFDMDREADAVEKAVQTVLTEGYRTGDIMSEGCTRVGTCKMGDLIAERIG